MSKQQQEHDEGGLWFSQRELTELKAELAHGTASAMEEIEEATPRLRSSPFDLLVETAFVAEEERGRRRLSNPPRASAPPPIPAAPRREEEADQGPIASSPPPAGISPSALRSAPPRRKMVSGEIEVPAEMRSTQPQLPAARLDDSPFTTVEVSYDDETVRPPTREAMALAAAVGAGGAPGQEDPPAVDDVLSSSPPPKESSLKVAVATEAGGSLRNTQASAIEALSRAVQGVATPESLFDGLGEVSADEQADLQMIEPPSSRTPVVALDVSELVVDDGEEQANRPQALPSQSSPPPLPRDGVPEEMMEGVGSEPVEPEPEDEDEEEEEDEEAHEERAPGPAEAQEDTDIAAAEAQAEPEAEPEPEPEEEATIQLEQASAVPTPIQRAITQPLPLVVVPEGSEEQTTPPPQRTRHRTPALGMPVPPAVEAPSQPLSSAVTPVDSSPAVAVAAAAAAPPPPPQRPVSVPPRTPRPDKDPSLPRIASADVPDVGAQATTARPGPPPAPPHPPKAPTATSIPPPPPPIPAAAPAAAPPPAPPPVPAVTASPRPSTPGAPPPPPPPISAPPPVPQQGDEARQRKKRRGKQWFEEIFDEDYLRTLPYLTPRQTEREVNFLIDGLELAPGSRVLDVGCGYGRHAMELASRGHRPVGIDLSLPLLIRAADAARRVGVNVDFVHGDMREMSFDNEFDAAYCVFTTFGYFDDDTNRKVAAGICRALKPGGRIVLDLINRDYLVGDLPTRIWWQGDGCVVLEEVDFNYFTSRLQVQRQIILEDGRQLEQEISIRAYSLHEIGKVLHHAGFRVLEVSGDLALRGRFFGCDSRQLLVLAEKRPTEP